MQAAMQICKLVRSADDVTMRHRVRVFCNFFCFCALLKWNDSETGFLLVSMISNRISSMIRLCRALEDVSLFADSKVSQVKV